MPLTTQEVLSRGYKAIWTSPTSVPTAYLGTWTVRVYSHLSRACIRWETYKIHMMGELLIMPSHLSFRENLSDTDAFT